MAKLQTRAEIINQKRKDKSLDRLPDFRGCSDDVKERFKEFIEANSRTK